MKKYSKTAALALLIALVFTACAGKNSQVEQPKPAAENVQDSQQGEEDKVLAKEDKKKSDRQENKQEEQKKEAEAEQPHLEQEPELPVLNPDTVVYAQEEVMTTSSVNVRKRLPPTVKFIRQCPGEVRLPERQMTEPGVR